MRRIPILFLMLIIPFLAFSQNDKHSAIDKKIDDAWIDFMTCDDKGFNTKLKDIIKSSKRFNDSDRLAIAYCWKAYDLAFNKKQFKQAKKYLRKVSKNIYFDYYNAHLEAINAYEYLHYNNLDSADACFYRLYRYAKQNEDTYFFYQSSIEIAKICIEKKKFSCAEEAIVEIQNYYSEYTPSYCMEIKQLRDMQWVIGNISKDKNNVSAVFYLQRAYNYSLELGESKRANEILMAIIRYTDNLNHYQYMLDYSTIFFETESSFSDSDKAYVYAIYSHAIRQFGKYDKAQKAALKAIEFSQIAKDTSTWTFALELLAWSYIGKEQYIDAKKTLKLELELAKKINRSYRIGGAYNTLGIVNAYLKEYDEALVNLNKAVSIYKENGYIPNLYYENIAWVYREMNKNDLALSAYHQSLNLTQHDTTSKLCRIYGKLSKFHQNTNQLDSAIYYKERQFKCYYTSGDHNNGLMAEAYYVGMSGNNNVGIEYAEDLLNSINEEIAIDTSYLLLKARAYTTHNLADFYGKNNASFEDIRFYANNAVESYQQISGTIIGNYALSISRCYYLLAYYSKTPEDKIKYSKEYLNYIQENSIWNDYNNIVVCQNILINASLQLEQCSEVVKFFNHWINKGIKNVDIQSLTQKLILSQFKEDDIVCENILNVPFIKQNLPQVEIDYLKSIYEKDSDSIITNLAMLIKDYNEKETLTNNQVELLVLSLQSSYLLENKHFISKYTELSNLIKHKEKYINILYRETLKQSNFDKKYQLLNIGKLISLNYNNDVFIHHFGSEIEKSRTTCGLTDEETFRNTQYRLIGKYNAENITDKELFALFDLSANLSDWVSFKTLYENEVNKNDKAKKTYHELYIKALFYIMKKEYEEALDKNIPFKNKKDLTYFRENMNDELINSKLEAKDTIGVFFLTNLLAYSAQFDTSMYSSKCQSCPFYKKAIDYKTSNFPISDYLANYMNFFKYTKWFKTVLECNKDIQFHNYLYTGIYEYERGNNEDARLWLKQAMEIYELIIYDGDNIRSKHYEHLIEYFIKTSSRKEDLSKLQELTEQLIKDKSKMASLAPMYLLDLKIKTGNFDLKEILKEVDDITINKTKEELATLKTNSPLMVSLLIGYSKAKDDKTKESLKALTLIKTNKGLKKANIRAEKERENAIAAKIEAERQEKIAEKERENAIAAKIEAERQEKIAEKERENAIAAKIEAERQEKIAKRETQRANNISIIAIIAGLLAILVSILAIFFGTRARRQAKQIKEQQDEFSHRILNNLHSLNSYIQLQVRNTKEQVLKEKLRGIQRIVFSMAGTQEYLEKLKSNNTIQLDGFIERMLTLSLQPFGKLNEKIEFDIQTISSKCSSKKAFHLGLVLNELVTNSCKYAFIDIAQPKLTVITKEDTKGKISIEFSDNGVGFAPNYKERMKDSLGSFIIKANVRKLKGKMEIDSSSTGTKYTMTNLNFN